MTSNDSRWKSKCCQNEADAAEIGHLECLAAAHANGFKFNVVAAGFAARYRRYDCLQFLIKINAPIPPCVADYIATQGNIDVLHELISHGAPIDIEALANAAEHGHLECVRAILPLKKKWPESVLWGAIMNDKYDCVVELCEYGVEWTPLILEYAKHSPSDRCLLYLKK